MPSQKAQLHSTKGARSSSHSVTSTFTAHTNYYPLDALRRQWEWSIQ